MPENRKKVWDHLVPMPSSEGNDWQLLDAAPDESEWGRDPLEILIAEEEGDEDL